MNDANKMREQFLAWLPAAWDRQSFVDDEGDEVFADHWVQGAWIGWQASREAVVVDLPDIHVPAHDDDERWHNIRNSTIAACKRAIAAQGLKVAP